MVIMNLFTENKWRFRSREWTCEHWGKERLGKIEKVALTCIQYHDSNR